MKSGGRPLAMVCWLAAAQLARGGDVWVSYASGDRDVIAHLTEGGANQVLDVDALESFGESADSIAIVGCGTTGCDLQVIDKRHPGHVTRWPLPVRPAAWLSGPIPDVVLTSGSAYLISLDAAAVASPSPPPPEGVFRLTRVEMRDGSTTLYPLGREFANPRLRSLSGKLVMTDWEGYAVSTFSPPATGPVALIRAEQLPDILPEERREQEHATLPLGSWSDYVTVPGAGVFRLSKFGFLHHVAGADLDVLPAPHRGVDVGPARQVRLLFAARSKGRPAIGVLTEANGAGSVLFVDAESMQIAFKTQLPATAILSSLVASGDDSVAFVNASTSSVIRHDARADTPLARFPNGAVLSEARIISIGEW